MSYPVTGISWYEAAAYAEFAGKSLPTIYHWNRAAGPFLSSYIVPASNFGSSGVLPVGSKPDMGPWGTYDMAGNVKEWIWTEAEDGKRYVMGGAWDEPNYMFVDPDAQSPFLRPRTSAFAASSTSSRIRLPKQPFAAMPTPRRDLTKEKPVSDQIFEAYRGTLFLRQNAAECKRRTGETARTRTGRSRRLPTRRRTVNEQAISYLFLPKKGKPPYQVVLFFPGSDALSLRHFAVHPYPQRLSMPSFAADAP